MSLLSVINILLITEFCQSIKPNSYQGRYFHIKPIANNYSNETQSSRSFGGRSFPQRNKFNQTLRNVDTNSSPDLHSERGISFAVETPRASLFKQADKTIISNAPRIYKFNFTEKPLKSFSKSSNKNKAIKIARNADSNFTSQPISRSHRYKSGTISDILSQYPSSQQERDYVIPTITATLLNTEVYHPAKSFKIQNNTLKSHKTPTPVQSASFHKATYHRPSEETTTVDSIVRPIPRPTIDGIIYNQSIVHLNEPKYLQTPPLRRRKQRNLREISVDKLIEDDDEGKDQSKENEDDIDSNITQSEIDRKGSGFNNEDDANSDTTDEDDAVPIIDRVVDAASPSNEEAPLASKHEMRYLQ